MALSCLDPTTIRPGPQGEHRRLRENQRSVTWRCTEGNKRVGAAAHRRRVARAVSGGPNDRALVDRATLGSKSLPSEDWFDGDCELELGDTGDIVTTFNAWDEYDEATHVLTPADVVYVMAGADGALYKLAILDYYSTPAGGHGNVAARFKLRVAPLP